MKDVQVLGLPPCDLCGSPACGVYNTPTRRDDPVTLGRWANMCGPCFQKHGLDTSVTERRVTRRQPPDEVAAIARRWGGSAALPTFETEGVWRFQDVDYVYLVFSPGADVPMYEDDGSPAGDGVWPEHWAVRCVNDAPDCFWLIHNGGDYVNARGQTEKVW